RAGQHAAGSGATIRDRTRSGMAWIAERTRRVETDPDEPWRALPARLRRRLGKLQSLLCSAPRVTAHLSVRASPFLDRPRSCRPTDSRSLERVDRLTPAVAAGRCAIREHLQPGALPLSRSSSHLRHAGASDDRGTERAAECRVPIL